MAFAAVVVGTALLYGLWVAWAPLLPGNLYVPLLDLGKITGYTWRSAYAYLFIVGGLYAQYAVGYLLVRRGKAPASLMWLGGGLMALILVFAYPATAVDVFGYIAHGRLLAEHGVNPFTNPPDAFPGDAIVPFLAFPGEPSQYGPVWVLIGGALASAARGNLLTEILLFKLIAAVAHVVGAVLVLRIARILGATECQAHAGAYLYLWNPLLLWEMVGNAHNDGVMMLCVLVAIWLLVKELYVLVLPALMAGVLVKAPVLALAPLLFVAIGRRNRAAAIEGVLLALLLAGLVYRPFWEGPETLTVLKRTDLFTASLGSVLRLGLADALGLATASTVARVVSLAGFGVIASLALVMSLRANVKTTLLLAYVTLVAAVLLATTWFQAWYVVWPAAVGAALADGRRHLEVALLSLGGLLQYFVFIYLWVIGVFPPNENLEVQSAAYVAIVGPPLVGLAYLSVAHFSRRSFKKFAHAN